MPKLSSNKKQQILEMLKAGSSYEEITEVLHVAKKTIIRIKKELTETDPELALILSDNHSIIKHRKTEEVFLQKAEKEQALFEDVEEGWTYHITLEQFRLKEKGLWWQGIMYPESMEENTIERLRLIGCELAISPLHDKDLWTHNSPSIIDEETGEIIEPEGERYKIGDRKKFHYHFIIKFPKTKTFREVNNLIRPITKGPYLQKCHSLKGAYEYFIHLNNPEKYQYEKDEIQEYNNFRIEANTYERKIILSEACEVVKEKGFTDLMQITTYYEGQIEYINVVMTHAFALDKLCTCNWRKENPDGKIQKVKIIKED